ncbi:hypothetical protein LCGC14_3057490 [marine sediment metagenome]|uniref:Uncharacterized protein n=1 Tax=marine sediment metagenome TaxID=412755 RepID=A0A0F8ZAN5_9ZZZZ
MESVILKCVGRNVKLTLDISRDGDSDCLNIKIDGVTSSDIDNICDDMTRICSALCGVKLDLRK